LGQILAAVVELALKKYHDLPGIDQPDEGHKESIHEEHHKLFLNHAIWMLIEIMETQIFHG
jgi:hypothetical protein